MKKSHDLHPLPLTKTLLSLLFINGAIIVFQLTFLKNRLPPVVPLLFGKPQGEEQLVPKLYLTAPPLTSSIIALINTALIKSITNHFLKYVLLGLMLTATVLSTITVIKIVLLVGYI